MNEGRDDFLGQPVKPGDQVVFMLGRGRRGRRAMTQGYVLKVGPQTITVRYAAYKGRLDDTMVRLDFARVPDHLCNPNLVPTP